jgi:hypothetical protein
VASRSHIFIDVARSATVTSWRISQCVGASMGLSLLIISTLQEDARERKC